MSHVVNKELALDIKLKGSEGHHVLDGGDFALKGRLVNGKNSIALDANAEGVVALHFVGLNGNHTSDGSLNKADLFVKQLLFVVVKKLADFLLEVFVGADKVFADDDVKGSLVRVLPTLSQSSGDVAEDEFEDVNAHGGGHDVGLGDGVCNGLGVLAVNAGNVFDHGLLIALFIKNTHGIFVLCVQLFDNCGSNVDKGGLITRL